MSRFILICFGGALGTGARYLLSGLVLRSLGPGFPYGTPSRVLKYSAGRKH